MGAMERSSRPSPRVALRPVTRSDRAVLEALAVRSDQRRFVPDNAAALAEAEALPRAHALTICVDGTPAGLVVLRDDPEHGAVHLWRLMLDARHQGRGIGRAAIARLVAGARARTDARALVVVCAPDAAGPAGFYRALGFTPDGALEDGEIVLRLTLAT